MRKILLVCILIMLGTLGRTTPAYAVIDPYLVFVSETEITIRWATSPVKYAGTVNYGITSSFTHSETEAGGNEFHTITLTGLRPNTLYYYEATGNGDTSGICSFRTAPPPDSGFTFLAYGDTRRTGSGPGFHTEHEKVIHSMLKHNPQTLILHTGDFTYDGSIDEWVPTLLQPGRDIYKNNVFYGSIGNHCYDRRNDVGSYQHLFSRSADPNAPDSELYYSFDYGNVHFVALDLNWNDGVDYSVGTTQYNWLKKDLESEAAKRATWIVVFGHYPAYTTGNHGNDNDIRAIRGSLVPLFENTGVDIYICGHDHIYERSYKNGVHYLVTGGGGAPLRKINVVADPYREYGMNPTGYNHCLIEAGTDTMTVKAFDVAGSMFDIFSVPKRQVIDAFTRQGIPGVSVTLHTGDGRVYEGCPQPNPQITKADGSYYFQVGAGTYYLVASREGYEDFVGKLFTVGSGVGRWGITMTPTGFVGPSDTNKGKYFVIKQTVNKNTATVGDILTYTVTVAHAVDTYDAGGGISEINISDINIKVSLPHDFRYVENSTRMDGQPPAEPPNRRVLTWFMNWVRPRPPDNQKTITYRVIIGPDAKTGKNKSYATATALATGDADDIPVDAGPSAAVVDVKEGLFCRKELVTGKVFHDTNQNGVQDRGEEGVAHAPLIMEDGKRVVTDAFGRFSIPEVPLGVHIMRIDPRVLPGGPLTKEATLADWEKGAGRKEKGSPESLIERRTLGSWIDTHLFTGDAEDEDDKEEGSGEQPAYRPDLPRVSRFFTVYETQTTEVNFPLRLLSGEETKAQAERDGQETQFMFLPLADGQFGYLAADGNLQNLRDASNEGLKNSFHKDGSMKFYLKGRIKGRYLLTARFDTDTDYGDHLFEYINPEKYYPIYGDGSTLHDETDSQGKFFVRLERADTHLAYANYSTEEFAKTELSKYGRTLHGIKAHFETKDFEKAYPERKPNVKLDFFGSETRQDKRQDIIAGNGLSGPYFLTRTPAVEYTELVRIQTRDSNRSDIVLSSETKTLDLDYEIDYDEGKIVFKEPVPTHDRNGDPVSIVIDYEYVPLARVLDHYIMGTRAEITFGEFGPPGLIPKFSIGSQFVAEQKDTEKLRLVGVDTVVEIVPGTRIQAEYAYSDNLIDKPGDAWRVEGSSRLFGDTFHIQAYATEVKAKFSNPVQVTEAATQRYGVTAQVKPLQDVSFIVDHYKNRSIENRAFTRGTKLDLFYGKERYMMGVGYDFQESDDERGLSHYITDRTISVQGGFKITPGLVGSATYELTRRNEEGRWRQVINTISPRFDLRIDKETSLYARHDYRNEKTKAQDRPYDSNISSIGLRRHANGVENFVEYGFVGGRVESSKIGQNVNVPVSDRLSLSANNAHTLSADKNEENIGYGAQWEVFDDLFVNFLWEREKTSSAGIYKEEAQSVAVEYRPQKSENVIGVKLEQRRESEIRQYNLDGNARLILNDSVHFISRGQFQMEKDVHENRVFFLFQRLMGGFAFRPVVHDRLNILAKYEFSEDEDRDATEEYTDSEKHIASAEALYDLTSRIELYGRYALKFVAENANQFATHSTTDLISARVRYKFTDWLDAAGIYHIIKNRNTNTTKQGIKAEMGIMLFDRARLAAGWNFIDYTDHELDHEDYAGYGPYVNCSLAVMETDLGRVGALRYMQSREERVRERLIQKRVRGMDDAKKNRLNGIFREAESLYRREEYREAGRRYDEIILAMTQLRYDVDAEIQSRLEREERAVSLFEKAEILYNRGEYARAKEIYAEVLLLASS